MLSTYQKKLHNLAIIELKCLDGYDEQNDKELEELQKGIKKYLFHYTKLGHSEWN